MLQPLPLPVAWVSWQLPCWLLESPLPSAAHMQSLPRLVFYMAAFQTTNDSEILGENTTHLHEL